MPLYREDGNEIDRLTATFSDMANKIYLIVFINLDKSRTLENGGSELGLAIVKRIIELHESVIKVTSEAGKKTVFAFSLKESVL